jgi:small subunit ribosomal protein S3
VGQKVHPKGFRLGIFVDWSARWYARDSYGKLLMEDFKIRKYLSGALDRAEIARIEIEKAGDDVKVIVYSARPGVVIGKKGQEIDFLRKKCSALIGKNVEISVQEVKKPEIDATLIAQNIADQLERRASYKQVTKRASAAAMRNGALGIKICVAGRLGGAEIARTEWLRVGSVPLHTLRKNIDYGFAEAKTTYGIIGVKVWVCNGEFH